VVVDDHDMGITHVIRGDDHLTNTFRQVQIYKALGWDVPQFSHLPMIHGPDGAKLSKRHGALGVEAYREMGYLPEAIRNYLLRLGWAHGNDEIIPTAQAIRWFDLDGIGRSPARFDFAKLDNVNGHYLREAEDARLVELLVPFFGHPLPEAARDRLLRGMAGLKSRARTLVELALNAAFYVAERPLVLDQKAAAQASDAARQRIGDLAAALGHEAEWTEPALEAAVRHFAETRGLKLGEVAQPLRAALTGSTTSPGIFEVMSILGSAETLGRMLDFSRISAP
jgi:glutamyl-tRNA synthetase